MNLKKKNRKELDGLTERFVMAMKQIIARHPKVRNRKQFGEIIGTIPPTINRWENKQGHPTAENIVSLCKKFPEYVSPSWLILGKKKSGK